MITREQLEEWLGEADSGAVAWGEILDILHVVLEASRRALAIADTQDLRDLRFAVAVLRDVFPTDARVRDWLNQPSADLHGVAPADLVSAGRFSDFADLAIAEWNRPRRSTLERVPRYKAPALTVAR
jgi:hypothetical protein